MAETAFREGSRRGRRLPHPLHGGGRGRSAGAPARRRRAAPHAGARAPGAPIPGGGVRDARVRHSPENTRTESMAELASTMAPGDRQARPGHVQPDGHLVRRQDGAVAGAPGAGARAGAGARGARRDPPGRRRAAVGHARGDRAAPLRAPGAPRRRSRRSTPRCARRRSALVQRLRGPRPRRGSREPAAGPLDADARAVRHPGRRHRAGDGPASTRT